MLVHHWSHPTTPAGLGWDTVISTAVRLSTQKGFSARAALGEADTIVVEVDDPDGAYDFKTLHRWYMVETETSGSQLVWNGYINDVKVSRIFGDVGYFTGTGRVWQLEVVQENTLLGFRVVTGTDGNRPAETASARLTWLLASNYLSTVHDHGLIDWTGLADHDMDAVDYRDRTAADVLRDISLISGFNHYARYNDTYAEIELACYDSNTSALDTSSLVISNDPADLAADGDFDSTLVYPPNVEAVWTGMGSRVAAGVNMPFDGGRTYGYDLETSYEFGFRDLSAPAANVKTLAKAVTLRDRLLAQHDEMDERVHCRIQVGADQLNAVKHGQLIEATFTHFPNWAADRPCRVISKSFSRPENNTQDRYDLDLELSPTSSICAATVLQYAAASGVGVADVTLASPVTAGSLLIFGVSQYVNGVGTPPGFTLIGSAVGPQFGSTHALFYKIADGTEGSGIPAPQNGFSKACWVMEISFGSCTPGLDTSGESHNDTSIGTISGSLTPTSEAGVVVALLVAANGNTPGIGGVDTLAAGWTSIGYATSQGVSGNMCVPGDTSARSGGILAYRIVGNPSGAYTATAEFCEGFDGSASNNGWAALMASFKAS